MLIEFEVANFRSIKDKQIFSMLPSGRVRFSELPNNIISEEKYGISLISSSVVYGANASGKSNLLSAFAALRYLVMNSINYKLDDNIEPYEPFVLDFDHQSEPVEFKIDFIGNDNIRYQYIIVYDKTKFLTESLHFYPQNQKAKLFVKEYDKPISYGDYFKGNKRNHVLPNQLLLSNAGLVPTKSLEIPYRFFKNKLFCKILHDTEYDDVLIETFTRLMAEEKGSFLKRNIKQLLSVADTNINDLEIQKLKIKLPEEIPLEERKKIIERHKYAIKTKHKFFDDDKEIGTFNFDLRSESTGTIKLLAVGGLILEALRDGRTIIIDELDKSLHPLLTRLLIGLFHSKENNPRNAQLIFATHDASLINKNIFRRDQIWLIEKDSFGSTEIFPLSDFTGISKIRPLENWYLRGRFGGIPNINEDNLELNFNYEKKKEAETS